MTTSGATVLAVLKEITDPARLEEINGLMDSLDDKESVLVAREVAAGLARLGAVQYRALARLSVVRGGVRSVVQEVALALSVVDGYAGSMVASAVALTTRLPGKNGEQVRKAASYAAARVDRGGAERRSAQLRQGRRLSMHTGEDGVGSIGVVDGPAEKVKAAYLRVNEEAKALKKEDGETRTMDQLRADVALDLLLGGRGGASERAEVFLYMDLFTYLGLNDDPVFMAGHGYLPAELGRHISSGANTVLRRIITDPLSGQVKDLGRKRYRPDAAMAEFVRVRDRECRRPGCSRAAQACELDHSIPWQHQGETNVADLVTYCARDHHLKDEPGWTYTVAADGTLTITTPTGQTYTSSPPPLHEPRPPADEDKPPPPF